MTKLAYLECPTGIAGDMCLGALVHAGVPLDYLKEKLELLGISGEYQLRAELVERNGQQATKVHVNLTEAGHHHGGGNGNSHAHEHGRHLPEIEKLITAARLPVRAEAASLAVFRKLAEAEGEVHGIAPEKVHFHEVGATDAIVDIVGTCLGLDWLGIDQLHCSPLPTGGGTVKAAHGQMPVPTPAVLKLWQYRQVPVYSNGIEKELVTPTGAAIAVTLASAFGSPPQMTIQRVGLGLLLSTPFIIMGNPVKLCRYYLGYSLWKILPFVNYPHCTVRSVWAFSSPELSTLSSQDKQFEPLGWFTKTAPIADIFLLPL